jgi:hypothetical protein
MLLTGIPGLQINMTLQFMPRVQNWVMGLSYGEFSAQGIVVTTSLNMLRQFKNNIPFGISCVRDDGLDPFQINDFAERIANLYLLNSDDVAAIEAEWFT